MAVFLSIRFRRLSLKEWSKGLIATSFFAATLLAMSVLTPFDRKYRLQEQVDFYREHPPLYVIVASLALVGFAYIYGPVFGGWIARSLTNNPAVIFDQRGIDAWTETGRQKISWSELQKVSIRRPMATDSRSFVAITLEGSPKSASQAFTPTIVIDTDTMDFDMREVVKVISTHRPDLI